MSNKVCATRRLKLGKIVITRNAADFLIMDDVHTALHRHANGDWGDVSENDRKANNIALKRGLRILSSYRDRSDAKIWIITEADRRYTTILLPEEY